MDYYTLLNNIPIGSIVYWKVNKNSHDITWDISFNDYLILATIYLGEGKFLVPKGYGLNFNDCFAVLNGIYKENFPKCQVLQYDWRRLYYDFYRFYNNFSIWVDFSSDQENV